MTTKGENLFTNLSSFEATQRTFNLLLQNFCGVFFPIGLLHLPLLILIVAVYLNTIFATQMSSITSNNNYGYGSSSQYYSSSTSPTAPAEPMFSPGIIVLLSVLFVLFSLLSMVGTGATIRATADLYAGEQPSFSRAWQVGLRNVCRLFCFGLMLQVAVLLLVLPLGLVLFFISMAGGDNSNAFLVACLILIPTWLLFFFYSILPFHIAPPSVVVERQTLFDVFHRAWALSEGGRCTIFLASFMLAFVNQLIGLIPFVGLFWALFMSVPLTNILATVLFFNFRIEKEGLNVHNLRNELGFEEATELVVDASAQYRDEPLMVKTINPEVV